MAYSVAYQHTDSNRNHDGSDVVHGTLKSWDRGTSEMRCSYNHYYFVLYTFKGFRAEERMLNTVILLEL